MSEPDLACQKARGDASKRSSDDITHEMPVAHHQQQCREEQQSGKRQDSDPIEPHEDAGECSRDDHVARRKTAARRAGEEVEGMWCSMQHGRGIRHSEKPFQRTVVDCVSTDGGQTGEHGCFAKGREMPAHDADDNQGKGNRRFEAEKNCASKARCETFSRTHDSVDAAGNGYVEIEEYDYDRQRASKQGEEPDSIRSG